MALFDCATVRRIDASYDTPMLSYRGLIVHIAVSNALFPSYLPGTKADFYIRKNGTICQEIDTAFRSGAHLNGNADYLSVELEGGLDPGDLHAPMPRAQLEALGRLMAEANRRHGIPLRLMTDTNPRAESSRGLGYHRLGVPYRGVYATKGLAQVRPGWLQSPTDMWFSKSQGKECPGDGRIAQMPEVLAIASGTTPRPSQEDTMSPEQESKLDRALQILEVHDDYSHDPAGRGRMADDVILGAIPRGATVPGRDSRLTDSIDLAFVRDQLAGHINGQIAGLTSAIAQIAGGHPVDLAAITEAARVGAAAGVAESLNGVETTATITLGSKG